MGGEQPSVQSAFLFENTSAQHSNEHQSPANEAGSVLNASSCTFTLLQKASHFSKQGTFKKNVGTNISHWSNPLMITRRLSGFSHAGPFINPNPELVWLGV